MPSERLTKNYSFISEGSFRAESTGYDWYRLTDHEDNDDSNGLKRPRELRAQSSTPTDNVDDVVYLAVPSHLATTSSCTLYDKEPIDFGRTWMDSDMPMVGRSSSAPPPIQLLQEAHRLSERRRAATAPPMGFFNHLLYGSLRRGVSVELFSHPFCGLAISAAATGFLTPFLTDPVSPLVCNVGFSTDECAPTRQLLQLPGVGSFFLGLLSDFYPVWSFHRKSYMVMGWTMACVALTTLSLVAWLDDTHVSVHTFDHGVVHVLLLMGTSLGITIASIAAFAFLIELSQREPVHERGMLLVQYLLTQETATLVADIVLSVVVRSPPKAPISERSLLIKLLVLLLAIVACIPVPAVVYRLDEEPRQLKVDAIDRSSLTHQLWYSLQQQAVWRILVFVCVSVVLSSFTFSFADDAVLHWAHVSPPSRRYGAVANQSVLIASIVVFQRTLLNSSWVRLSIGGVLIGIATKLLATIPTIFNGIRSAWYSLSVLSLLGISQATMVLGTLLPIVEITETGLEGATTGLVASYTTVLRMVILTLSNASKNALHRDFSDPVLARDAFDTRTQVLSYIVANCAIKFLVLVPIVYFMPRQKLEAQEMRTKGEHSRLAGFSISVLFVALVIYAVSVTLYALLNDTE